MAKNDDHIGRGAEDPSRTLDFIKPLYELGSQIGGYTLRSVLGEGGSDGIRCDVDRKVWAAGVSALKPSQWLTVRIDLLPYIRNGLHEAVKRGYLRSSNSHDYAVANMNLGWEIPGTFDAAIQVEDLKVLASLKAG
jgi:hypothetical protein